MILKPENYTPLKKNHLLVHRKESCNMPVSKITRRCLKIYRGHYNCTRYRMTRYQPVPSSIVVLLLYSCSSIAVDIILCEISCPGLVPFIVNLTFKSSILSGYSLNTYNIRNRYSGVKMVYPVKSDTDRFTLRDFFIDLLNQAPTSIYKYSYRVLEYRRRKKSNTSLAVHSN